MKDTAPEAHPLPNRTMDAGVFHARFLCRG